MTRVAALNRLVASVERWSLVLLYVGALVLSAWVLLLWWFDLQNAMSFARTEDWPGPPPGPMDFAPLVSGALCALLVPLVAPPWAGPRLTLAAGVIVPLSVLTVSVLLWPLPKGMFGYPLAMAEAVCLLVVLALAGVRCRGPQVALVAVLVFLAVSSNFLREPFGLDLSGPLLVLVAGLAPGLYLHFRRAEREAYVERIRSAERLSLARDLHDVVAHEVTGIVVQAQALRHVADRDPDAVRAALPEIEAAGTRALDSMRGMVSRLREPGEAPLAANPAEGLAALGAPAAHGRPQVGVHVTGDVAGLPPDTGTAVLRIAQESVTNALRYARGATRVSVVVTTEDNGVLIRVIDDGRGGGRPVGGGHGLVGMAERARLLGGELTAGSDGIEQGWTVRAFLPTPRGGDETA